MSHYLPTRIPSYLLRLYHQYGRTNPNLASIIGSSHILIVEETGYDNWNGGQHGHDVILFVPINFLSLIDIDAQSDILAIVRDDIRKLSHQIEGEYINNVRLEMEDENDPDFQRARPFSDRPQPKPEQLGIWKSGLIRTFISHRDQHKGRAHHLAEALEPYGFSCFVAHDTIPANEEWRKTIVAGLETMEVMLVFLTDDFQESIWTMQEVGYALGRGVPYVSLKLQGRDPPGFISHTQALRGNLERPDMSASDLVPLLAKAVGKQDRLQSAMVAAFVGSRSFVETRDCFDRMADVVSKLTEAEIASVIEGFYQNDQLHNAAYLGSKNYRRLRDFLARATGRDVEIEGRKITVQSKDDLPF